jgi:multiple sugar transport system substrate-binding protein
MTTVRLVSWGHRRATDPLRAAYATFKTAHPEIEVVIDVRPLSDFEHQGMPGVAERYDLIVFDHPFCGEIAKGGLFLPLEERFPALLGPAAGPRYLGPSLETYRFAGHVWGAPIDAATQNAVFRADLLDAAGETVPTRWEDVLALGARLRARGLFLGTAIETPHALVTIGSLMANAGRPWATDPAAPFTFDRAAFAAAYDQVRELLALCPPDALGWNSIDLHEAMVARDDVAYCPAVYGYATYGEADQRRPLSFGPFAGAVAPYEAGSVIGGTAIGVSARCRAPEAAFAFVEHMLEETVQRDLVPAHHGQPALTSGWREPANDRRFNGFYSGAASSVETAWTRPRRPGYPVFQGQGGRVVADGLKAGRDARAVAEDVAALAERCGSAAHG